MISKFLKSHVVGLDGAQVKACAFVDRHARIASGAQRAGFNSANMLLEGPPGTGKNNLGEAIALALCQFAGFKGWVKVDAAGSAAQVMLAIKQAIDTFGRVVIFLDEYHACKRAADKLKEGMIARNGLIEFSMPYYSEKIEFTARACDVVFICASNHRVKDKALRDRAKSGMKISIPFYGMADKVLLFEKFVGRDHLKTKPNNAARKYLLERVRGTGRAVEELITLLISRPVTDIASAREFASDFTLFFGGLEEIHLGILECLFQAQGAVTEKVIAARVGNTKAEISALISEINASFPRPLIETARRGGEMLTQAGREYIAEHISDE